jgi:hypothetical protein
LCSYSLQDATEGSSQNVSSIWKDKDQRSPVVTWKPDLILYFLAQIPMYAVVVDQQVYASYIADRERILLATEVTPGLQQEQSPTPISLCHDLFNGVINWKPTQDGVVLTPKLGQVGVGR